MSTVNRLAEVDVDSIAVHSGWVLEWSINVLTLVSGWM